MMKWHFVWIAGALLGVVACTTSSGERHATVEQRVEADDAGTDAVADAAPACAHAICATGEALTASCDTCATQLCAQDPYCCAVTWDATCVSEVTSICGQSCTTPPPTDAGGSTCTHPVCSAGVALSSTCDACATQLCAQDAYCCTVSWDATCVSEVGSICGKTCQ